MKTNQLILAAAAALLALSSCNKNVVERAVESPENEIGFNVVNQRATKANGEIISGAVYRTDDGNSFQVWGWQSQAGDFSEFADNAASNFMSNLTISYCGGPSSRADAWRNAAHYYYWPLTGKISFLAVHPSEVAPTTTGWDATNKKPQATFADYTIKAETKTVDLMLATNEGSRQSAALPMVFNHALSQILLRVRTNEDYSSDVTFTLNSVTINNVDLSGDLVYANGAFTWSDNALQTEDWAYYATPATVTNALAEYGAANVMVPQTANASTTLTINYTMKQTGSDSITGTVVVPASQKWEAGKKYVYTLNFNLNEILFDPTVTNWAEVTVDTINI